MGSGRTLEDCGPVTYGTAWMGLFFFRCFGIVGHTFFFLLLAVFPCGVEGTW